jgi:SAM-dependent methyltransferase
MNSLTSNFKSWEDTVQWLRVQPDRQELVLAAYYDDPLVAAADRYWNSEEWNALRNYLPAKGGHALDVGAGRGIASYALAKDGFQVTSLEPDGSGLVGADAIRGLAQDTGLPISVTEEFSERLPFAEESFDLVFARAVLHHTTDLDAACQEFFRVLKPGGMLLAVREHVISHADDLPRFLEIHPLHKLYGGENAFLLSRYTKALAAAGFELKHCLTPLESPINFAPHTSQSLRTELANRMPLGNTLLFGPFCALLRIDWAWQSLLPAFTLLDHRPGRLYSFVCLKGN